MSFRDDHDAALARAEALENELDAERAKTAELAKQLESERAERQRLEALVPGRSQPQATGPGRPTGPSISDVITPKIVLGVFAVVLLFLALYSGSGG